MKHLLTILFFLASFSAFCQVQTASPIEAIIQMGHSKTVTASDISHNGKYIATGSIDRSIVIWEKKSGKEIRILHHHVKSITALHFSKDDQHILSASNDNTVKLSNIETGEVLHTFLHTQYDIENAMFNGDGSKVIIFDKRQDYSVWESATGEFLGYFTKDYAAFDDARTVSFNGELVLSKINYDKVACIKLKTKATLFTLPFDKAHTLNFSNDGKFIVIGSAKLFATVFDAVTGDSLHTVSLIKGSDCDGCNTKVAISDDSKSVFTTSNKGLGKLWNIKTGKTIATFDTPKQSPNTILFTDDNKQIVINYSKEVKIYSATSGKEIFSIPNTDINHYNLQVQNNQFILPGENHSADLWSVNGKKIITNYKGYLNQTRSDGLHFDYSSWIDVGILQYISYRTNLSIHPNNQEIVLGKVDSSTIVLNLNTGKKTKTLTDASKVIFCQAYSKDGKLLAVAGGDRKIRIYDAETYILKHTLVGHQSLIFDIQFSNNSNVISSASWDGTMRTWDIEKGTWTSYIELKDGAPYLIRYSPNDLYILTGDLNKNIDFWESDTRAKFRTLIGHSEPISGIEFSKDGQYVVTSSWDGKIKLWHTLTGMQVAKFNDKGAPVYAVNFSPDQKQIISGDGDRLIKFWNRETGQLEEQLAGHISAVTDIQLTSDGSLMISRGMNGEVIVWDYTKKKQIYTYLSINRNDWIIKTPSGHFDGSKKALQLVNYVSGMEVIAIASLFDKYYTPGLAKKVMDGESMDDTGENMNSLIKNRPELAFQLSNQKKNASVIEQDSVILSKTATFSIDLALIKNGEDISEIRIYNNGKLVDHRTTDAEIKFRGSKGNSVSFEVELVDGINNLRAVAKSGNEVESDPVTLQVKFDGEAAKVDLFILTVGINNYKNSSYNLSYATKDAKEFSKAISKGGVTLFNKIYNYSLEDNQATKAEIQTIFKELIKNIGPEDVFVFYYAGHGAMSVTTDPSLAEFYIMTHNVTNFYGEEILKEEGISATELLEFSRKISAQKQLFILDACHSGGALNVLATRGADNREKAIAQLARNTGTFFLTASQDFQYANESGDLKHGLFTYALLEIIGGDVALNKTGKGNKVTVNEMKTYVEERVPELSEKYHGSAQYPTSYSFGQDFPIVILK
ncbi:MAG TPA: caspase family protein [Brumimicrobium sp.]|nr:caspase family protein [Brumimicrobium sp.]